MLLSEEPNCPTRMLNTLLMRLRSYDGSEGLPLMACARSNIRAGPCRAVLHRGAPDNLAQGCGYLVGVQARALRHGLQRRFVVALAHKGLLKIFKPSGLFVGAMARQASGMALRLPVLPGRRPAGVGRSGASVSRKSRKSLRLPARDETWIFAVRGAAYTVVPHSRHAVADLGRKADQVRCLHMVRGLGARLGRRPRVDDVLMLRP